MQFKSYQKNAKIGLLSLFHFTFQFFYSKSSNIDVNDEFQNFIFKPKYVKIICDHLGLGDQRDALVFVASSSNFIIW